MSMPSVDARKKEIVLQREGVTDKVFLSHIEL